MDLFLDTNIVLDLLSKREPFVKAAQEIFSRADKKSLSVSVSALTIANVNYVLSKSHKSEEAKNILRRFKILVKVFPLNDKIIELALNDSTFTDLEDAFQYYSALENNSQIIITRNLKDFKNSKLPVLTAEQFLAK